jgi:SAM-dependent methyltransferase
MTDYTGVDNLDVMRLALNYNRHLCEIVSRYDPGAGSVIDFGAGLGTFSGCALGDRSRVLCVEADRNLRTQLLGAGYRVTDEMRDVPDESVAYVFSLNVLEHIADDAGVVRDLARRMQPGGRMMLYLPAFHLLYSSMDRKVGHHRRYSRATISALLTDAGLSVRTASYEDFLGFFATLVFKWTDRRHSGEINERALVLYDRWLFPISRELSRVFGRWVGKNLLVVAEKDPVELGQPSAAPF